MRPSPAANQTAVPMVHTTLDRRYAGPVFLRESVMTTLATAPVLFISHGAPTFALEPGKLGPQLHTLGAALEGITAILVISPHWQSRDVRVMSTVQPETMHDFGGFPEALYLLRYPAAGAPDMARAAASLLHAAGFAVTLDDQRGLDHGAWVPLYHMLPDASIPVFQVSMPVNLNESQAFALGRALTPLRRQGVLILGSGSMTHNLSEFRGSDNTPAPYVEEFAAWVHKVITRNDAAQLLEYRTRAPHAVRAHPTDEHFLPLLVALGASTADDAVEVLDGGITHGMLSMASYFWRPVN